MKTSLIWFIAISITLGSAIYQRATGPTYPLKSQVSLGQSTYSFEMLRSHGGKTDAVIEIPIADEKVQGTLHYRRYPTDEVFRSEPLIREKDMLLGTLPHQPPAGKLEYFVELGPEGAVERIPSGKTVVIRFKGGVPSAVLIPHVLLMFMAMLMSNVAGLRALIRDRRFKTYAFVTFGLLLVGGMILGPVMQLYAFGELWTGVPFGWDLTDNKTLIAFLAWIGALLGNRRKDRPALVLAASLVTLIIFMIPHSMWGSELNPETGKIITG